MFKTGTKCINIVLCVHRLIKCIADCQMVKCDEVVINDHRGYLVDLEIERYVQCKLSKQDKPRHAMLNNNKKSHVVAFNEKVNEVMHQLNLKQRVIKLECVHNRDAFNIGIKPNQLLKVQHVRFLFLKENLKLVTSSSIWH